MDLGILVPLKTEASRILKKFFIDSRLSGFMQFQALRFLIKVSSQSCAKKGGYEHLLGKDEKFNTPKLQDLPKLAENLALKNKTTAEAEFKKLFKQKSMIVLAPFLFSVGVMGFFVAGCSRYFTQYRYNKEKQEQEMSKK